MSNPNDIELALPELSDAEQDFFTKQFVLDDAQVAKEKTDTRMAARLLSTIRRKRITVRHTAISLLSIQGLPPRAAFRSIVDPASDISMAQLVTALVATNSLHQRRTPESAAIEAEHPELVERYLTGCKQGLFAKEFFTSVAGTLPNNEVLPILYPVRRDTNRDCYIGHLFVRGLREYVELIRTKVGLALMDNEWTLDYFMSIAFPLSHSELFEQEMKEQIAFDALEGDDLLKGLDTASPM